METSNNVSSGGSGGGGGQPSPDLAVFVQDLLEQMQTRFSEMGDSITGKMDDMGRRMDELESSTCRLWHGALLVLQSVFILLILVNL